MNMRNIYIYIQYRKGERTGLMLPMTPEKGSQRRKGVIPRG